MDSATFARALLQDGSANNGGVDCSADRSDCSASGSPMAWRIGALFLILFASSLGVYLPYMGTRLGIFNLQSYGFTVARLFAAGVVLATGFVHVLGDGYDLLSSDCLGWGSYPWAMAMVTASALLTCVLEFVVGACLSVGDGHPHGAAIRFDAPPPDLTPTTGKDGPIADPEVGEGDAVKPKRTWDQGRRLAIAQVLEIGIAVHSVLIGIGLGTSYSICTIRTLAAALVFHQFFEGIALGGALLSAGFHGWGYFFMAAGFALTTPSGVAIGIGIQSSYNENSATALGVEGSFDSIAAGILIYMALVDLIAVDIFSPRFRGFGAFKQFAAFAALFLGAFALSLIGKWA